MRKLLLFLMIFFLISSVNAVVFDHTAVDQFDSLTQEQTDKVRDVDWLFGHQSSGRNIMTYGFDYLESQDPKYSLNIVPYPYTSDVTRNDFLSQSPMFGQIFIIAGVADMPIVAL